jgi:hypothetical protein
MTPLGSVDAGADRVWREAPWRPKGVALEKSAVGARAYRSVPVPMKDPGAPR